MENNEQETREMSPALQSAIQQIQVQANRQVQETLQQQRDHLGLPDDAQADLGRGVWVIPAEEDDPEG